MCGIVGIVGETSLLSTDRFLQMRDSIAHRGPDDAGFWKSLNGHVLLGSRRLAILDLSASGHQPMQNESNTLTITFNGEIYNYLEIGEELRGLGYEFRSRSDTEVILKAYEAWGSDCLRRFNGMFAFAIWDERRQQLFAARDRFGEKPFYFYQDPDRGLFAFSSEIKALLISRLFERRPAYSGIVSFLTRHDLDAGSDTMFQDVCSLPPAHALLFSKNTSALNIWRYWDLNPEAEIRLRSDKEYAERLLELLADSVRLRLRSDVPVGSSLSGGLDSSTIVGLIARVCNGGRQATFSARFEDPNFDEGKYIQSIAEWTGVESHVVYPDPAKIAEEIGVLTWHQDHPFYSTSIYAQWSVMRLAKQYGVTVLLDGQGGDETLAGYHSYFGAYYRQLLKEFRLGSFLSSFHEYYKEHGIVHMRVIVPELLPLIFRFKRYLRPLGVTPELEREGRAEFVKVVPKFRNRLHQQLYVTLTSSVLPQLLRYADRNSMAFSREIRLPFLDHRVVEFLFTIPADQKIRSATTKIVLRNAIAGIVPEEIRNRRDKLGYAPPESAWLRRQLRPWVEEILGSQAFRQRGWVEPNVVRSIWQKFLNGQSNLQTVVWRWLSLEIWARTFLDATSYLQLASNQGSRVTESVRV